MMGAAQLEYLWHTWLESGGTSKTRSRLSYSSHLRMSARTNRLSQRPEANKTSN